MIAATFDHLHIKSQACEVSADFYAAAFGAEILSSTEVNGQERIVLDLGGIQLFIENVSGNASNAPAIPAKGMEHIGLQVLDLDEAFEHLTSLGIEFAIAPRNSARPGIRMAFLHGPDGEYIALIERR